jgi:hypothetical protein
MWEHKSHLLLSFLTFLNIKKKKNPNMAKQQCILKSSKLSNFLRSINISKDVRC